MKCLRLGVVLVATLSIVYPMPPETTTTRSTPPIGETIKRLTNQLMDVNTTKLDMVYDARTPPKIKQQQQNKMKLKDEMENSHAGVAIPVDEDALEMEETTKKLNFYKLDRPTTNSGLSTWILLSGQTSLATKSPTTRKSIIKQNTEENLKQNVTVLANDKPNRIIKPIFKKRISTTLKPSTTTKSSITTTTATISKIAKETTTKLTKVKASILNNAVQKKSVTASNSTKKPSPTTIASTAQPVSSTDLIIKKNSTQENVTVSTTADTSTLPAEAKEGEVDLTNSASSKKKKTSGKRKKNKTRRRKPVDKDTTNSTSISKPTKNHKQKPIGTQLYNYLAREIMPTVGVGLVGLMVTAGLASYFLYPFGALRRSYDVDRKDKEGSYYYSDDYSGGMPEEEAIGKVIAGMPSNSLFVNSYKSPTSRNTYPNVKHKLVDRRAQIQPQSYGQSSAENSPLTSIQQEQKIRYDNLQRYQSNSFEPMTFKNDQINEYSSDDKKFVVGNIPKDTAEVAPAAVPEHGPRSLNLEGNYADEPTFLVIDTPRNLETARPTQKPRSLKMRRKRRGIPNDVDNEISSSFDREIATVSDQPTEDAKEETTLMTDISSIMNTTTVETPTTTVALPDKVTSFFDLMKKLIHLKAKLGLQIIQSITRGISKYVSRVQARLDQHYRQNFKSKN